MSEFGWVADKNSENARKNRFSFLFSRKWIRYAVLFSSFLLKNVSHHLFKSSFFSLLHFFSCSLLSVCNIRDTFVILWNIKFPVLIKNLISTISPAMTSLMSYQTSLVGLAASSYKHIPSLEPLFSLWWNHWANF